jgi:hypothetical protein
MTKTQTAAKSPLSAEQAAAPTVRGRANKRAHGARLKSGTGAPNRDSGSEPSKSDRILKLLRRKNGASIENLQDATGWQAHSVRGFLSATVKKRLGLSLRSELSEKGERRYLIVEV